MEIIGYVKFICQTCEYNNKMNLGMNNFVEQRIKNFVEQQTEFDSLTEAFEHLMEHTDKYTSNHQMIAVVEAYPLLAKMNND